MASSNNLRIRVNGVGGHSSNPQAAVDPVTVAAEIILALQSAVTRSMSVLRPVVLSITNLTAGVGALNAIPATVDLGGSVRVMRNDDVAMVRERIHTVATHVAAAHGASVDVDFQEMYPAAFTDPTENDFAVSVFGHAFGEETLRPLEVPFMGSEDFGYVLGEIPGTFMFYGSGNEEILEEEREWNHSPFATFDDEVLGDQAASLAVVAFERLAAHAVK